MNLKDFNKGLLPLYVVSFIVSFGLTLALSFLPIYLSQIGISLVEIGVVFALASIIAGIVRFPIGALVESKGRKPLILFGAIGYPIFAIGLIMAKTTGDFILVKIFLEIFAAIFWTALLAYMYDVIRTKRAGRQIAIRNISGGIGVMLAPVTAGFIIVKYGFPTLFVISGAVSFIALLVALFFIKETSTGSSSYTFSSMKEEYSHILHIKKYRYYLWIGLLHNIIWVVWYVYMPIYLKDIGMSTEVIGLLLSFNMMIFIATSYPIGRMIDKFPTKYLIIPGFFLAWAAGYWFLATRDYIQLAVSRSLIGVGMVATWEPMIARISSLTPKREHGFSVALFRALNSLLIGSTTIGAGWLASLYGISFVLKAVSILAFGIGVFLIFFRHELRDAGIPGLKKHHAPLIHHDLGGHKT